MNVFTAERLMKKFLDDWRETTEDKDYCLTEEEYHKAHTYLSKFSK